MKYIIFIALIFSSIAYSDEIGLRLGSRISTEDNAVIQFPPGPGEGKTVEVIYDYEPFKNFYFEGTAGYQSPSDIFQYTSMAYSVSPGVQIQAGPVVMKLSEGLSYIPADKNAGYNNINFVTHLTFGLKDEKTGIGVYLDRSHYSNGSDTDNPGLNYTGFMLLFRI